MFRLDGRMPPASGRSFVTVASLMYPMRGRTRPTLTLFIRIRRQWSRDPALWRSIVAGLGMAALGLAMIGATFGILTP
jgi:hypothetical protein